MRLRYFFQIILVFIILSLLGIFYYKHFYTNKASSSNQTDPQEEFIVSENISNQLTDIEYNSTDDVGNTFYINAKKALVNIDDKKKNLVQMEGVISLIGIKNKGNIYIYSKNAIYNKISHDTSFYNNIEIQYLDNSINSENFDIFFSKKISKIYNNVICKSNNLNLYADNILIDMISGNIKFQMEDDLGKVKLIKKNELIN